MPDRCPHCFGDIGDDGLALPTGMPGPMSAPAMRSALHLLQLLGWETGDDEASARTAVELRALDTVHAIIEAHLANLSASAETGDPCEIPAPAISQSLSEAVTLPTEPSLTRTDDIVQRARQFLDGVQDGPEDLVRQLADEVEKLQFRLSIAMRRGGYDLEPEARELMRQAIPSWANARGVVERCLADVRAANEERDELRAEAEKLRSDLADEPYLSDRLRDARRDRDELRDTIQRVRAEVQYLAARDQILINAAIDGGAQ